MHEDRAQSACIGLQDGPAAMSVWLGSSRPCRHHLEQCKCRSYAKSLNYRCIRREIASRFSAAFHIHYYIDLLQLT